VPGANTTAGSSSARRNGSPAQSWARAAVSLRPFAASGASVGCSVVSCIDAARFPCCNLVMGSEPAWKPLASVAPRSIPHCGVSTRVGLNRRARSAQSAEDCEGILGQGLVDELPACLRLAVEPLRELLRLVLRRCSDQHVRVTAQHAIALVLEPAGELFGLLRRSGFDSSLPGRVPVLEALLLGLELLGRLVVPAVLVGEPVLDRADLRFGALFAELGLDDRARSLGLVPRTGIDEDRLVVPGDGE